MEFAGVDIAKTCGQFIPPGAGALALPCGMAMCRLNQDYMTKENNPPVLPVLLRQLRRLKWNERVQHGDYVGDDRAGFEPLEGLNGFRADSFVKQIYRRLGVKAKKEP